MGRIVRGSDCHSQRLDPLLRGQTERFGGGRTVRPLWGRIVSVCKRLWGRIVTVSDSAGRSVTVSKRGVALSSRHRRSQLFLKEGQRHCQLTATPSMSYIPLSFSVSVASSLLEIQYSRSVLPIAGRSELYLRHVVVLKHCPSPAHLHHLHHHHLSLGHLAGVAALPARRVAPGTGGGVRCG
jgi:hypothetical protein